MDLKVLKVGFMKTNCYILEFGNKCLIIDPGDDSEEIISNINLDVSGILITHNHFDHVGAIECLVDKYNVDVYDYNNLCIGENIIDGIKFNVVYNPGHTFDSISFIFGDCMFSGDFIFYHAIGRCDVGGDYNIMLNSICELLKLNINYKIYPGHGRSTYLFDEVSFLNDIIKNA